MSTRNQMQNMLFPLDPWGQDQDQDQDQEQDQGQGQAQGQGQDQLQGQGQDQGQGQGQDQGQSQFSANESYNGNLNGNGNMNGNGNLNGNANLNANANHAVNTASNASYTDVHTVVTTQVDLSGILPEDNDFADLDLNGSTVGDMVMLDAAGNATYTYDPGNDLTFTDILNGSLGGTGNNTAMVFGQSNTLEDNDYVKDVKLSNDGSFEQKGDAWAKDASAGPGIDAGGAIKVDGVDASADGDDGGDAFAKGGDAGSGALNFGSAAAKSKGGEGGDGGDAGAIALGLGLGLGLGSEGDDGKWDDCDDGSSHDGGSGLGLGVGMAKAGAIGGAGGDGGASGATGQNQGIADGGIVTAGDAWAVGGAGGAGGVAEAMANITGGDSGFWGSNNGGDGIVTATSEAINEASVLTSAFNQQITLGANILGNTVDMTVVGGNLTSSLTSAGDDIGV